MVAAVHEALVAAASPRHLRKAAADAGAGAQAAAAGAAADGAATSAAGAAGAQVAAVGGGVRVTAPGVSVGPTGWQVHCVGGGRRGRPSHDLDLMVCHPAVASAEQMSQLFEATLGHLIASGAWRSGCSAGRPNGGMCIP